MSTPPPTPSATISYLPALVVSNWANVQPGNALTAIMIDRFSSSLTSPISSLLAVWKFFTTVYLELLHISVYIILFIWVMRDLHLDPPVAISILMVLPPIGLLFTGYRKLQGKHTRWFTRPDNFSPWIKLTGNRLLKIVLVLAFGIYKLVESIENQTMTASVVDFIYGVVCFLITNFIDYFEQDHPTMAEWFFRMDYSWFVLEHLLIQCQCMVFSSVLVFSHTSHVLSILFGMISFAFLESARRRMLHKRTNSPILWTDLVVFVSYVVSYTYILCFILLRYMELTEADF